MSRRMGAKASWALSGLALDSSSGAPGPLKGELQGEGGHKTCLPTPLGLPALEAQARETRGWRSQWRNGVCTATFNMFAIKGKWKKC